MIRVQNITDEAHQQHILLFEESEIVLTLRYHPTIETWTFDIEYKGIVASGYKLSVGVAHMQSRNLPFDFIVRDQAGLGLDPIYLNDFSTDRCALYMLEAADMEELRGQPVPL